MPHLMYLMVAKTRAKVLWLLSRFFPIPRPMLYIGENTTQQLCQLMLTRHPKHILIVTDSILQQLGVIEPAKQFFINVNITVSVYDKVTPDPTLQVVVEGLSLANQVQCDAILAIGGGSVIDAAKMIALSQGNHCQPQKLLGILKARKPATPFYVLPSTSGTGSEATIGAVISDDITHQKAICIDPKIVPIATGIDPSILQGMPPSVTADTGIDVLTHAIEAWYSVNASTDTDYYAASAIEKVLTYLPTAYHDGKNIKAREEMGVAAHYAGLALNKAGLGYVHAIAHQLGAFYGVPHGRANAIVLPYILDVNAEVSQPRIVQLAKTIGMVELSQQPLNDHQIATLLTDKIKQLIKDLNITTYVKGMNPKDFDNIIIAAQKEVSDTYSVPRYLTQDQIRQILVKIAQVSS